jgi:trehalose 6-phosphate phosphatase
MRRPTDSQDSGDWALFLDVDGTLLDIAETPEGVYVPDDLKKQLLDLSLRAHGALALVSGRSIEDLDRLFAPLRLPASGVHGCERRDAAGRIVKPIIGADTLPAVRGELQQFVDQHPGLLLEDKGFAVAMHFRRAPHLSADVLSLMRRLCQWLGPTFTLQAGKCVLEIRPTGFSKGTSIAAFMREAPFAGRTPIFLGDDVTDEDGFAVVNDLGGISIKVGEAPTTLARGRLRGVREVRHWLQTMPLPILAWSRA